MKLPNVDKANIPEAKIVKYLLSSTHRAGKSKAAFFTAFGFTLEKWSELVNALRRHAAEHVVNMSEETVFGTRYVVDGLLNTPEGKRLHVRSAWFIDKGSDTPRFVTAFPLKGGSDDSRT